MMLLLGRLITLLLLLLRPLVRTSFSLLMLLKFLPLKLMRRFVMILMRRELRMLLVGMGLSLVRTKQHSVTI
ncbi:P44 outermembrane protein, silent [Anaplasma phagocytophilum]|uniref:p44 outermembrane protein, silent n=1 Tax=Anaplasma phagocytophilum TaxID=948 RepID=A0A098EGZ9_ANAPH|nr:P44 outermembrane protein, silent [Anaplasma phagocytophilum]